MGKEKKKHAGGRIAALFLSAALAPAAALYSGANSLAAKGDIIRSGTTGDCTYQIIGENDYDCTAVITGTGAMEDYKTVGYYRDTGAPWRDDMPRIAFVDIREGVTAVGNHSFSGGLTGGFVRKVVMADSVRSIRYGAFYEQPRLQEIQFGNGLTYIGWEAFYKDGITDLHFPVSLKNIDDRAFIGARIKELELPDSVTKLGVSAFKQNYDLETVVFGNGLERIEGYAFNGSEKLKTLVIPASLKEIDENAFEGCNIEKIYYGGTPAMWSEISIGDKNGTIKSANLYYGIAADQIELSTDMPIKGTKLSVRFTGGENPITLDTANIRWQRSWDGQTNWTDLTGTVDPVKGENYYEVTEADEEYRIRAIITKAGFPDEIVTEPVKVLDGINIEETFQDSILENYLSENFDTDHDGQLTSSELERITTLHLGNLGVHSLHGIRNLTDLQYLYAYNNDILYADLSDMDYLEVVDLSDNTQLGTVKLSGCKRLKELDLAGSGIKTVDISDNPELKTLNIYGSSIGRISIRQNPNLVDAALHGDVKEYSTYTMYKSELGQIGIYAQTPVVVSIDDLNFPCDGFREMIQDKNIDWDQDGALSLFEARDVKALFPEDAEDKIISLQGIEYFPNLTHLSSFNCRIKEVDLRGNKKLTYVDLAGNQLEALDISMLSGLTELDVDYNPDLKKLDVSQNPTLETLYCAGIGLTKLDLSANTGLMTLDCGENELLTLDVSRLAKLEDLNCGMNPLTSLDLSKNKALVRISVSGTGLGKLDVSGCPELKELSCSSIGLTALDLSKNPKLYTLYCEGNAIPTLDIGASASLRSAYAGMKTEMSNSETGMKYWYYRSIEKSYWQMSVDKATKIKADAVISGSWKKSAKGWWYLYSDGTYPKDQWAKISGKWYHFDKDGYMQTGWLCLGGKWYYLTPGSGVMYTGWLKSGSKWYYLIPGSGVMATGWQKLGAYWYYFNPSGVMLSGWQKINGYWYFLRNGIMVTGWQQISGKWYFFSNGVMVTGTKTIGGKSYQFDTNGVCLNP